MFQVLSDCKSMETKINIRFKTGRRLVGALYREHDDEYIIIVRPSDKRQLLIFLRDVEKIESTYSS